MIRILVMMNILLKINVNVKNPRHHSEATSNWFSCLTYYFPFFFIRRAASWEIYARLRCSVDNIFFTLCVLHTYVLRCDAISWHKKALSTDLHIVCKCTYVPIVTVHMNCYQIWWRRRKCPTFMPLLLRSHVLSLVTWRSKLFLIWCMFYQIFFLRQFRVKVTSS